MNCIASLATCLWLGVMHVYRYSSGLEMSGARIVLVVSSECHRCSDFYDLGTCIIDPVSHFQLDGFRNRHYKVIDSGLTTGKLHDLSGINL